MYLWIMYFPISKHGWANNATTMTPTMKTMCSIGSLLQLSATSFHRYMSGSVLESFRTFWSTDFSIALVLCWFRNYPSSESSDHGIMGLSGVRLRELACVIDAVWCHDGMFSAMHPPDEPWWTIGSHGPTVGSALSCLILHEGCVFLQLLGRYLKDTV